MKQWGIVFTKQAQKDALYLSSAGLRPKAEQLLDLLAIDPFKNRPSFGQLVGDLKGSYSRRINIQHRLVYQLLEQEHIVKVLRMWSRYE